MAPIICKLITTLATTFAAAFQTTPRSSRFYSCRSTYFSPTVFGTTTLLDSLSDQNNNQPGPNDDSPAKGDKPKQYSVARVGGRKTKKKTVNKDATNTNDGLFGVFRQVAFPILLAAVVLKLLFGNLFGGPSPNVVYYSSSVYQSTIYKDGNVETSRKESFESNIPGLVERARESSQGNGDRATRGSSYYGINSIEDELLDVEDEINSIFGKW